MEAYLQALIQRKITTLNVSGFLRSRITANFVVIVLLLAYHNKSRLLKQ